MGAGWRGPERPRAASRLIKDTKIPIKPLSNFFSDCLRSDGSCSHLAAASHAINTPLVSIPDSGLRSCADPRDSASKAGKSRLTDQEITNSLAVRSPTPGELQLLLCGQSGSQPRNPAAETASRNKGPACFVVKGRTIQSSRFN